MVLIAYASNRSCIPLYQLVSSAYILFKQFGPRTGPTRRQAWSRSKLFDTLMVFIIYFFFKKDKFWEKGNQWQQLASPSTSRLCECEQWRPWLDDPDAQAHLIIGWSRMRQVTQSQVLVIILNSQSANYDTADEKIWHPSTLTWHIL